MATKSAPFAQASAANNDTLADKQAAVLAQFQALAAPMAQLLVSQGIGYNQVLTQLKQAFMEAAALELTKAGDKKTDAAISLLSGVHRKDVRAANIQAPAKAEASAGASIASQVYTQWLAHPAYQDNDGRPKAIALAGEAPSFEALVASVSKDFHRRTVLDELVRLGLVTEKGVLVEPRSKSMTPIGDSKKLLEQLGQNNSDHLQASVENVQQALAGQTPRHLEQSVYANGLSEESIAKLEALSRQLWKQNFDQLVHAATQLHAVDMASKKAKASSKRMRVGMYFYSSDLEKKTD